uniref:Putative calcium-binding protein CML22 n=1 Tax=Anthurium amnicola TaxID=1678845 RepID=A0A1D1Y1T7_9ARAE
MGEAPGSFHVCSALKSLPKKVGDRLSHCSLSAKYRRLDRIFEKKMEAVKDRTSTRPPAFKTMNSIIRKFPKFREQLRNIQSVFEQCDEDSNGTIDHEELKKCLAKLKVHLTEQEIDDLYHYCDIDGKEGIQYKFSSV